MPQTLTFTISDPQNEEWITTVNDDTDLTLAQGKTVVLASAAVGGVSIYLPTAAAPNQYRVVIVKKLDATANLVSIIPDGSETIDGASSYTLGDQYESVIMVSNGSNWHVLAT